MFEGIGFNKNFIEKLQDRIKEIWVFYHATETILLKTTPKIVLEKGIEWQNKKDIKDQQIILPITNICQIENIIKFYYNVSIPIWNKL